MEDRKFTVKKDPYSEHDHYAMRCGRPLPPLVDLSEWLGPVKDQGNIGSCTAHTGTSYREFLYRKFHEWEKDKTIAPIDLRLSPLFFYAQERLIEGTFNEDNGAQSRTMMEVMAKIGCCLESVDPYDVSKIFVHPSNQELEEASRYKNTSYHRVTDIETARSVIFSGYCVSIGMPVYQSFQSDHLAQTGKMTMPSPAERNLGGHEVLIYGYDDNFVNLDGSCGAFMVRNSWGENWGVKGNFFLPYTYVDRYADGIDMWCAHLGRPWK